MLNNELNRTPLGIYYYQEYQPWHGGFNPRFRETEFSGRILDLKGKRNLPLVNRYFSRILDNSIISDCKEIAIICCPSHTEGQWGYITSIVEQYCVANGLSQTEKSLIRLESVPKKSHGGIRSLELELNSCVLTNLDLLDNKHIIIVDDVTTSGGSLLAAKKIVESSGINCLSISCFAFGQTV